MKKLIEALHHVSLVSQNSAGSKDQCGRIAREALAKHAAEAQPAPADIKAMLNRFASACRYGTDHERITTGKAIEALFAAPVAAAQADVLALIEEAFTDGFCSPLTYNDTVLNTAADAWSEQSDYFAKKLAAAPAALPPAQGEWFIGCVKCGHNNPVAAPAATVLLKPISDALLKELQDDHVFFGSCREIADTIVAEFCKVNDIKKPT